MKTYQAVLITASNPRPSNYVDDQSRRAVDVDVSLTIDAKVHKGSVTLCKDCNGRLSSWGCLEHWMDGSLIEALWDNKVQRPDVLKEIEVRARAAAESL